MEYKLQATHKYKEFEMKCKTRKERSSQPKERKACRKSSEKVPTIILEENDLLKKSYTVILIQI